MDYGLLIQTRVTKKEHSGQKIVNTATTVRPTKN
jgi:hypothetical protein